MHRINTFETAIDTTILTRRSFAGGTLAALMAAGLAIPATAQGLKEIDEDDASSGIPEELEEIGVTGDYSYESPQFGFSIEWADPWKVDVEDPGESSSIDGIDSLNLLRGVNPMSGDGCYILGVPPLPIGIHGHHEPLYTEEGRQRWFSDEFDAELLLSNEDEVTVEFLLRLTTSNTVVVMFLQCAEVTSDTWVMNTMVAGEDTIEDVFTGLEDQVLLNGKSIVSLTTWRDIERAMR